MDGCIVHLFRPSSDCKLKLVMSALLAVLTQKCMSCCVGNASLWVTQPPECLLAGRVVWTGRWGNQFGWYCEKNSGIHCNAYVNGVFLSCLKQGKNICPISNNLCPWRVPSSSLTFYSAACLLYNIQRFFHPQPQLWISQGSSQR